jgi:hypothetical protein
MDGYGLPAVALFGLLLFLVVLAGLWLLLPFAVFGTKDKLDTLISEAHNVNKSLREIIGELQTLNRRLNRNQPEPPLLGDDARDAAKKLRDLARQVENKKS